MKKTELCLLAIIFLFFSACRDPYSPQFFPNGKGSVTLVVDGADARTISPDPDKVTIVIYTIKFLAPGTDTALETFDRTAAELLQPFLLVPGTYDIQVIAYIDAAKTRAVARGEVKEITVVEGTNVTQNINLNFIVSPASTGTFKWEITVPNGLSSASMKITPVGTGTAEQTISLTGPSPYTGSRTLNAGYYQITFELKKEDAQEIIFREILHVFDNLESSFSKIFTEDHFNNIKYAVTFNFDNGVTGNLLQDRIHGEKADAPQSVTKSAPAGLYLGEPPANCDFDGWYDESGVQWDFANNPVTGNMTLKAKWIDPDNMVSSVPANDIAAAVNYVNSKTEAYTLLLGGSVNTSNPISLANKLTVTGISAVTITHSNSFNVASSAALTIGNNITFFGSVFINPGASLSLSGDAKINSINLSASSAGNPSVTIMPGWNGNVTDLYLSGDTSTGKDTVIGYWVDKAVLQGDVTATAIGKFSIVRFMYDYGTQKLITDPNPPDAPGGYKISTDAADIGKLVAINYAARITNGSNTGDYPTLNEAISKAGNGSADNPIEIVILRDITAPEAGISNNACYAIGAKHIKLTVESGKTITITASSGDFALFQLISTNSSLTLDGGSGSLTLDGKGATAANNRNGVYVLYGNFIMNNNVTITGFYNSYIGGAGVYFGDENGTFIMNGGTITKNKLFPTANQAFGGGGVRICGTFIMNGGTIIDNTSSNRGGGVEVVYGTFTMNNDAKIETNISDDNGGGVLLSSGGTLIMNDNTEIKENTSKQHGGGVYVNSRPNGSYPTTFILNKGIITGNKAPNAGYSGGGVYVNGDPSYNEYGIFEMKDGTISNNIAGITGGGVTVVNGGKFTMSGGTIYGVDDTNSPSRANTASTGAALYNVGGNAKFDGAYGGGMYAENDIIVTTANTLPGQARYAARIGTTMYLTLNSAIFAVREGYAHGSGTASNPVDIILLQDIVTSSNSEPERYNNPSAIHIRLLPSGNRTIFYSSPVVDNNDYLFIFSQGSLTLDGTGGHLTLNGNNVNGNRGGVALLGGALVMKSGVTITGFNESGVCVSDVNSTFTMSGGTIEKNGTSSNGKGGVNVYTGKFIMSGGEIKNNTSNAYYGGGVYVNNGATFTMSGGTIYGIDEPSFTNKAPSGAVSDQGAALYNAGTASYSGNYTLFGTSISSGATNTTLPPILNVEFEMALIPAGTFNMGSPESESNREYFETQHSVTLTKSFYMGNYQVTQEQYQAVMGTNPSKYKVAVPGENGTPGKLPVEQVSWYDVLVFCNKLSIWAGLNPVYSINGSTNPANWGSVPASNDPTWNAAVMDMTKNGYRIPTEAEWEYACRAETTTAYNKGDTFNGNIGWYKDNSVDMTHRVGSKSVNAWGLYDMHGNVSEWCWDRGNYTDYASGPQTDPVGTSTSDNRIARGGCYSFEAKELRSAARNFRSPQYKYYVIGFRLVRTVTAP